MSPLVIIFLTVFIDLLGFGIIIPLLPFYAEAYGASAFMVGLLGTSFSLMQFLFSPVWGRLSDRYGRRRILLLGMAGYALASTALAWTDSMMQTYALRFAAGASAGAVLPAVLAAASELEDVERRASRLAWSRHNPDSGFAVLSGAIAASAASQRAASDSTSPHPSRSSAQRGSPAGRAAPSRPGSANTT